MWAFRELPAKGICTSQRSPGLCILRDSIQRSYPVPYIPCKDSLHPGTGPPPHLKEAGEVSMPQTLVKHSWKGHWFWGLAFQFLLWVEAVGCWWHQQPSDSPVLTSSSCPTSDLLSWWKGFVFTVQSWRLKTMVILLALELSGNGPEGQVFLSGHVSGD